MSRFLYHEPCPSCGSKDNLAVFDDGHKWCFGCHYFEGGKTDVTKVFNPEETLKYSAGFPSDASDAFPARAMSWLLSCHLDNSKCRKYGIQWSQNKQAVCWQIKNPQGKVLGWQERCFAPDAKSKTVLHGNVHDDVCILGETGDALVLVEDYMSAVNVSQHLPAMPLFTCTCSISTLNGLRRAFKKLVIWLDADKLDNARKIGLKASLLGFEVQIVYSKKDPKNCTYTEIKETLNV